ncbi:alcohol dehydrogenase catalytic domain-containing protein [Rhodococcus qingshengii]|uniref:alcohol dehydrogenase catalytic domain-containing protein n=1 Tax=Rhodococcus qingshengii TaxID=334542 RepID=UPI00237D2097|nr:alcohol dehydrogenase catalytic domain-containing protein [Rhodococcus qingshengii]WCT06054.1 alcohol dehydrogenase catalytic domain-containing protein [Rhodococcus qingshengii]
MAAIAKEAALTALAARYHGVGDVRIESVPVLTPGSDEVLIEVAFCGICGSDLHEYFSAQTVTPVGNHPLTGQSLPVVLGHEFSGTVVERGNSVADIAVGDRVAVRPTYSCGSCESCMRGFPNTCVQMAFHGLSGPGGGLSTFTTVNASMAFVLPENVTLEQGALVEPMAVAYHGVARVVDENSHLAFVGGAGPIGLGALFALRACGVDHVIVSDPSPARRAVAAGFGATTLDPNTTSLVEVLAGRNLDIAVEAAGVGAVVESAVEALGPRGRLVLLGLHERPMSFDPTSLLYREVSVFGSSTYRDDDYRSVIAAMSAGSYDPSGWVEIRPMSALLRTFGELRAGGPSKVLIDLHQP